MGTKGIITGTMWRKSGNSLRMVFIMDTNMDSKDNLTIEHLSTFNHTYQIARKLPIIRNLSS